MKEGTEMDHRDILHAERQGMETEIGGPEALTPEPEEGMIGDPDTQVPAQGTGGDKATITVG